MLYTAKFNITCDSLKKKFLFNFFIIELSAVIKFSVMLYVVLTVMY